MRIKNTLIDAPIYALYMLGSCIACMFAEMLIVKVLTLLFAIDYYTLCIIRTVIYSLGVNAILCILAYREGYKSAESSPVFTIISGFLATAIHFPFALLFGFEAFCAGGVRFITALVKFGPYLASSSFIGELHWLDFTPVFFINGFVYCVLMAVAKHIGKNRRLLDREALTVNQSSEIESSQALPNDSENDF